VKEIVIKNASDPKLHAGTHLDEMFRLDRQGRPWIIYLRVTDTQFVELFDDAQGANPPFGANGLDHFCFNVDNLEQVVGDLLDKGLKVYRWFENNGVPELRSMGTGAIVLGPDGNKQAWLRDPDGNRVELIEMLAGNLQAAALSRLREKQGVTHEMD